VAVLRPEGPLTGDDAEQFKRDALEVLQTAMGRVPVDTALVPYVDSRGLEVLVEINEQMAQTGHALKLCTVSETVRQAMELTNVAPSFEYFADVSDAVRSFL